MHVARIHVYKLCDIYGLIFKIKNKIIDMQWNRLQFYSYNEYYIITKMFLLYKNMNNFRR